MKPSIARESNRDAAVSSSRIDIKSVEALLTIRMLAHHAYRHNRRAALVMRAQLRIEKPDMSMWRVSVSSSRNATLRYWALLTATIIGMSCVRRALR